MQGATKDIQQLFTAIDRRIEALRRNLNTAESEPQHHHDSDPAHHGVTPISSSAATAQVPFDDDDKESFLGDTHSSPDSSPDCRAAASRTRLAAATVQTVGVASSGGEGAEEGEKGRKKDVVVVVVTGEEGEGQKEVWPEGGEVRTEEKGEQRTADESGSDKESTSATPPSSRSPSLGRASTTTISSSDNAPEANFSQ